MRKLISLLTLVFIAVSAMAIPAHRGSATVTQPDGSKLTIELVGDEFYSFNITTDGYTVVKNDQGYYVYAVRNGESLAASNVRAHNVAQRTASEVAFLGQLEQRITDRQARTQGEAHRAKRDAPAAKAFAYNNFRGLIILINFTDVKFTMSDPNGFYDKMVNEKGFTGYYDDNNRFVSCTGSMHDYYSENSNGVFQPQFDIIGPVEVNYKSTDCNGTSSAQTIFRAAITAANPYVDFSKYDADGNSYVDMVFFQCAGLSSSFSGNDSKLLWPHKSSLYNAPQCDGKRFSLYACSTELYGWSSSPTSITIEGIGTMCHEFTHVMGFPDLYDTNYETNGQSHHPGDWDIMAGGGSFNSGRTPVGYTIFERYALGFATPQEITGPGTYTLRSVMNNEGYIMRSPIGGEYFIIDNRQKSRWDTYLPGHGMIVCRVDSTNTNVWRNNSINCNASRNYYEMFRAGNSTNGAVASDPFPGSMAVVELSPSSRPALTTWNGTANDLGIYNIRESGGVISFDVRSEGQILKIVEEFEGMPATTSKTEKGVQGTFAKWDFNQCRVMAPTAGSCNGAQAVAMMLPSALTTATPVYYDAYRVSFYANNTSSTATKLTLNYSTDNGATWTKAKDALGNTTITVNGKTDAIVSFSLALSKSVGTLFRISQTAGSKTIATYIDDFTIYYTGEPGAPAADGDLNGDGVIDVADVNILINIVLGRVDASQYSSDVTGDGTTDIADLNAVINKMLSKR